MIEAGASKHFELSRKSFCSFGHYIVSEYSELSLNDLQFYLSNLNTVLKLLLIKMNQSSYVIDVAVLLQKHLLALLKSLLFFRDETE